MPKKKVKTYTEMNNLNRAINKAGLKNVPYRVIETEEMGPRRRMRSVFMPIFTTKSIDDKNYIEAQGWAAEYTRQGAAENGQAET